MYRSTLAFIAVCLVATGCSSLRSGADLEAPEQYTGVDKHSTYPAIRRPYFEEVNLIELIDPKLEHRREYVKIFDQAKESGRDVTYGAKYDLALAWFRNSDASAEQKRQHRNSVQERILAVSTSRCNVFKTYVRRDQSESNFLLGSLTTAAGVLGAVLPGANASRNLAGAAGLFSGVQAEYNQAFFSNLAAQVIVKGIDAKQATTYERIRKVGQPMSVADYPMEAAIKDAIYYDGLCSTVVGLNEAGESIQQAQNPGLEAASRAVLRARVLQKIATDDLGKLTKDEALSKLGVSLEDVYSAPVAVALPESGMALGAMGDQLFKTYDSLRRDIDAATLREAAVLGARYVEREAIVAPPAAGAASAPGDPSVPAAAFKKLLEDKIVAPLKVPDLGKNVADTATKIATAQNSLRVATREDEQLKAKQALVKEELAAEIQRRCLVTLAKLVDIDIRTATGSLAAALDAAKDKSALQLAQHMAIAPDKSKNVTCP